MLKKYIKDTYKRAKSSALFKDSFWAIAGNVVGKGFSLIAGIIVARLLGKEAYGEYGIIKDTLLMIALFSSFGLGITATKFIAEAIERNPDQIRPINTVCHQIASLVSFVIAVFVVCFAGSIARLIEASYLENALRYAAIAIVLNSIITTQIGVLAGFKAYKATARNNVIAGAITFITTIPLTYFYGFDGAVIALVLSLFVNWIINTITIRVFLPKERRQASRNLYSEIIKFSFPIALQESLYSITSWGASVIIIKLSGYGELGLYNASAQWMAVMAFIPGALRNVSLSHLSSANSDIDKNEHVLKRLLLVNFVSVMLPCLFIWLFSSYICKMYGAQFVDMPIVLNVMVFTAVVTSLENVLTQELIALNQNWYLFVTRLLRDIGILSLTAFLLLRYSQGAFVFACVSVLFHIVYLFMLVPRYKHIIHKIHS